MEQLHKRDKALEQAEKRKNFSDSSSSRNKKRKLNTDKRKTDDVQEKINLPEVCPAEKVG